MQAKHALPIPQLFIYAVDILHALHFIHFISIQFKFYDFGHFSQLHQIDLICLSGLSTWEKPILME